MRLSDLWGSLSTVVDKLPQRSVWSHSFSMLGCFDRLLAADCLLHLGQYFVINSRLPGNEPDQSSLFCGVLALTVGDHKKVPDQFFGLYALGAVEIIFSDQVFDVIVDLIVVFPAVL